MKRHRPSPQWKLARQFVLERADYACESPQHVEGCSGRALHIHHLKLRAQGGTDHPGNLIALSAECHQWTHEHPAEAIELGLIIPGYVKISQ